MRHTAATRGLWRDLSSFLTRPPHSTFRIPKPDVAVEAERPRPGVSFVACSARRRKASVRILQLCVATQLYPWCLPLPSGPIVKPDSFSCLSLLWKAVTSAVRASRTSTCSFFLRKPRMARPSSVLPGPPALTKMVGILIAALSSVRSA